MADFLTVHNKVMGNEGGLANDKDDLGGLTYKGIAEKKHPGWPGFAIVKAIIAQNPGKKPADLNPILQENQALQSMVLSFYKTEFWNVIKGDKIISAKEAEKIYDSSVNYGQQTAIKMTQNVLFSLPNQQKARASKVSDLGILYGFMDQKTLDKLNNVA